MQNTKFIHDSACVENDASIGDYTKIWHFCHVQGGAIIGENCNLGQNVFIGKKGIVGNCCRLGNSVAIFDDVELHDYVFCGPFMVFTHVAFPRAAVSRKSNFKKTIVRRGATLGANSTILPELIVGEGAFVAAGAILTASCLDWSLMVGSPAKQVGWVSAYGEKIDLPLRGYGTWTCPHTRDIYTLDGDLMKRHVTGNDLLEYKFGSRLLRIEA